MKQTIYRSLSDNEREEISRGLAVGDTLSTIALRLDRPTSTISREIARNSGINGYRAFSAGRRAHASASSRRSGTHRLIHEEHLRTYVLAGLRKFWSPREIVRSMKMAYPLDMTMRISHEAIYQYIYVLPRGSLKKELVHALRQERKYRRKKGGRKGTP